MYTRTERGLHQAVLTAVEGEDRGLAAGLQDRGKDPEELFEVRQFAIHENTKGLEDPRCRQEQLFAFRRSVDAADRPHGRGVADDVPHFARAAERLLVAGVHEGAGDQSRLRLIAKFDQGSLQLLDRDAVQQVRGGSPARAVHSHVERSVAHEGEAAVRIVDLHAGESEVGKDAIDGVDGKAGEDGR